MIIPPCKKQIQQDFVTFLLSLVGGLFLVWALNYNPIAIFTCVIIFLLAIISLCQSALYFGRSFQLDSNGFAISLAGYSKKYPWDKVNCLFCEKCNWRIGDSEWSNPGVIISVKPINKLTSIAPMTYCRYTHPVHSVFLAYKSEKTYDPPSTGKLMHIGYIADKDKLLECIQPNDIQ